jgi:signal peptidase II
VRYQRFFISFTKFAIPALSIFVLDQAIKAWINAHLMILERIPIAGQNFYILARSLNGGLIWDLGSAADMEWLGWIKYFIPAVTLFFMGVIAFSMRRSISGWKAVAISFFFGGALSNYIDQWNNRFATDTFQIYIGNGDYLPHNLADIAITLGLFAWCSIWIHELRKPEIISQAL